VLSCFLDHRVDPPNGQGIKTEGQQLSGALNRDGSGIEPEAQQRSVALNIFFKLPAARIAITTARFFSVIRGASRPRMILSRSVDRMEQTRCDPF
jgi:hypothetical protein